MRAISPSAYNTINLCWRKYFYSYLLGWRRSQKAPWLITGDAFDKLLEIYDLTGYSGAMESVHELFTDEYHKVGAKLILAKMKRKKEHFQVTEIAGEPGNQLKITRNVPMNVVVSDEFQVHVRLDKFSVDKEGRPTVVERKTTSDAINPNSYYWNKLRLDPQFLLQCWCVKDMIGETPRMVYEVVRRPWSINKTPFKPYKTSKGEKTPIPIEEYSKNLEDYKGSESVLARKEISYSEDELDQCIVNYGLAHQDLKRRTAHARDLMANNISAKYAFPQNINGCSAFGGCEFRDVCEGKCDINQLEGMKKSHREEVFQ